MNDGTSQFSKCNVSDAWPSNILVSDDQLSAQIQDRLVMVIDDSIDFE